MDLSRISNVYDFDTLYPRHQQGAEKWDMMQADGPRSFSDEVFPLSVADMDFRIAPEIQAAMREVLDFGIFGYTQTTARYQAAVVDWFQRIHQVDIRPHWITPSPGVVFALFRIVQAFTKPGDGIIIQTPVYHPFFSAVETGKREIVRNPLVIRNGRYQMDLDLLEQQAARPDVHMMLLCSPHNPVGRVWWLDELQAVADICLRHQVLVVADEIHADLVFAPHRHIPFISLSAATADQSILCSAPSKTFNLAGLTHSNIIIPNADHRRKFRQELEINGVSGTNTLGTVACQAAYAAGEPWYRALLTYLDGNRQLFSRFMQENLPEFSLYPIEGTYLGWFDARSLKLDNQALRHFMREKAQCYFNEGYWFGEEGSGYERINLALPRQALESALLRLQQAVRIVGTR